jgi:hypothetical protein
MGLSALGHVWKIIPTAGSVVNADYGIHDMVKDLKKHHLNSLHRLSKRQYNQL